MPAADTVRKYAAKHRGTGYIRFDPNVNRKGKLVTRWGVWLNIALPEADA